MAIVQKKNYEDSQYGDDNKTHFKIENLFQSKALRKLFQFGLVITFSNHHTCRKAITGQISKN